MAVVTAVLVAMAAAGTFVSLRSGDGNDGRMRHRQFSGALDASSDDGAVSTAKSDSRVKIVVVTESSILSVICVCRERRVRE